MIFKKDLFIEALVVDHYLRNMRVVNYYSYFKIMNNNNAYIPHQYLGYVYYAERSFT